MNWKKKRSRWMDSRTKIFFTCILLYRFERFHIYFLFISILSLSLSLFQWNVTEQKTELGKSSSRCGDSVLAKAKQNARSWRVKYSLFNRASASLSRQVDSAEHFYFHGRKIAVFTSC